MLIKDALSTTESRECAAFLPGCAQTRMYRKRLGSSPVPRFYSWLFLLEKSS